MWKGNEIVGGKNLALPSWKKKGFWGKMKMENPKGNGKNGNC